MCNGVSKGSCKVDTFHVALLGFSLITMIILTYSVGYLLLYIVMAYEGFVTGISAEEAFVTEAVRELLLYMFILPQSIALMLWYAMPTFIKDWYALESLPPQYSYLHDIVRKTASEMEISPPKILYTRKDIANCFNLGKRESESTIVVSKWLLTHLNSDELEAVLTHEMAHAKNRDVTLMAYFAAVRWVILLSPLLICFGISSIFFQHDYSSTDFLLYPEFWILITPFLFTYLFLVLGIHWFSRVREATADARTSLFVDKDILKEALYKLACAKTMRMQVVPSCLMISSHKLEGILFTHPTTNKRFEMLDKEEYVIDTGRPPSFKLCLTCSVSILIFIQLVNYGFSAAFVLVMEHPPQELFFLFLDSTITGVLLALYYDYFSWKYLGVTILLIAFLQFLLFYVLSLPIYFIAQFLLPPTGNLPPAVGQIMEELVERVENLSEASVDFLKEAALFFATTFLVTLLLKYIRGHIRVEYKGSDLINWESDSYDDSDLINWESDSYDDSDLINWES